MSHCVPPEIPWDWPRPDLSELEPEALAFWSARMRYLDLYRSPDCHAFLRWLDRPWADRSGWNHLLRRLPVEDRFPVLYGCLAELAAQGVGPDSSPSADMLYVREESPQLRPEFHPHVYTISAMEQLFLRGVARGNLRLPVCAPSTVEVFPRRIWERWQRRGDDRVRILSAGILAVKAAKNLFSADLWRQPEVWRALRLAEASHLVESASPAFIDRARQQFSRAFPSAPPPADQLREIEGAVIGRVYGTHRTSKVASQPARSFADEWREDPALACSPFMLRHWYYDDSGTLKPLGELFRRSVRFPWVYPALGLVFQWHLFRAGKWRALEQIETIEATDPGEWGRPFQVSAVS